MTGCSKWNLWINIQDNLVSHQDIWNIRDDILTKTYLPVVNDIKKVIQIVIINDTVTSILMVSVELSNYELPTLAADL